MKSLGRNFETRISIAEGEAEIPWSGNLNVAHGAPFVIAGHLLDSLSGIEIEHAAGGTLGGAATLANWISARWTPAQAKCARWMLHPQKVSQEEIARQLGVSRQAVSKSIRASGVIALLRAVEHVEGEFCA